jgi:hypothetical protein
VLAGCLLAAIAVTSRAESPHGNLDIDCAICHDTESWDVDNRPPGFDHAEHGFPLTGGHERVACRECHRSLVFAHVGVACLDCHLDVHRGELGRDCADCHRTAGWEDRSAMIARHAELAFPLIGAHAWADCGACHRGQPGEEYTQTPTDCVDCHLGDYQAATEPDHIAAGFPTTCQDCHFVFATSWSAVDFSHAGFPLSGAHARAECTDCHTDGFGPLPTDCYDCHRSDYESAADPDHVGALLPTACAVCHGVDAWRPASFQHDLTGFPLTGAHAGLDCTACHAAGYTGTPTDCYACHQLEYDATTDPNHAAASFPTTCETCHTTAAWEPATWDHDAIFPIYTGRHSNAWTSCVECHVQPSDYGVFECIFCHEHNQAATDGEHDEVSGYVYESGACLDCHPRGVE